MLISGNQELIQQIEPELSKMTGKLWNLGEQPDKAAAIKLLGNLFHISMTGGIADMLTLAASLNISPADLGPLVELLNPSAIAQARLRKVASNTFDKASWELSMSRKDARLMIEQASSVNKKLPVISAVAQKMDEYLEKGYAKKDWTIIAS
jgi:3-hydroxyisobutyrate dehydrogenase